MKVDVKNVKINNTMSEETLCFSASLYLDGKRVGTVANRGTGGPHEYQVPQKVMNAFAEYAAKLPNRKIVFDSGAFLDVPVDIDLLVDDAVREYEQNKLMKTHWVFVYTNNLYRYLTISKSTPREEAIRLINKRYNGSFKLKNKEK